jgi:hypothetical protein
MVKTAVFPKISSFFSLRKAFKLRITSLVDKHPRPLCLVIHYLYT